MSGGRPCWVVGPTPIDYEPAHQLQKRLLDARIAGAVPDVLLLAEHPPTVTLGRRADAANVVTDPARLEALGFTVHHIERGGDVTYHGPGQITGYPIVSLDDHGRDLHKYMRNLEEVLIRTLARWGLTGERVEGLTGVWVGGAKVAALGIKVRRWVTMHGFALNVRTDLTHFAHIVPCGITDKPVTSLQRLLSGEGPGVAEVGRAVVEEFEAVFGVACEGVTLDQLEETCQAM